MVLVIAEGTIKRLELSLDADILCCGVRQRVVLDTAV